MTPGIKLAIVGGGPSAFFVASRLLQLLPSSSELGQSLRVHVYDRLWAPHGLVRYGVAPDHPEVKNCTHKFDEAARDARLKFFGNVNISSTPSPIPHAVDVPLSALFPQYTHLLFASGCTVPRLHPALPPSQFCRPALDLVHWYTQHPGAPAAPPLDKAEHVSVIGHGNVSLDIARMLLAPLEHLKAYDVPTPVLDALSRSKVKHVSIIGRRGPLEASFTTKELRELTRLPNAAMAPLQKDKLTRQQGRILDILKKGSTNAFGTTERSWSLDFFRSPTGLAPAAAASGRAVRLSLAHTVLDKDRKALPSGETSVVDTDLVVTSLGYRAEPTNKWYEPAHGHLRNVGGRVLGTQGQVLRNIYASGWAATGARGVLASTMLDAHAMLQTGPAPPSATSVLEGEVEDALSTSPETEDIPEEVEVAKSKGLVMGYEDWKKLDEEEVRRGKGKGKERERMNWMEARAFLAGS
ncbi:ferredoxin/adrenodoxin reductase [Phellopilus nigrolimitatus]|nr:ferredoxin/adrenodoxin reductase [Phellopilus nigrolimitatus]